MSGDEAKAPTGQLAYVLLWLRFLAVSWLVWLAWVAFSKVKAKVDLADIQVVGDALDALNGDWSGTLIVAVGFVLLWWRVVKVVVLQGSPLPMGMTLNRGRDSDEGRGGRYVTCASIGTPVSDNPGMFLYGAVFRSHPSSDKLVRTRLEFLMLSFPFGLTFMVRESRMHLSLMDHESRAWEYQNASGKYLPKFRLRT